MGMISQEPPVPRPRKSLTTAQKVFSWRLECLLKAGYEFEAAMIFAESKEDLHTLCDHRQAGMTDEQAIDIFT